MALLDEATQKAAFYEDGVEDGKVIDKLIEAADNIPLRDGLFKKYDIE